MRILFLTPYLPYPPNKGTALRNLYLLRAAAQSHQVHLLTFARQSDQEAVEAIRRELATVEAVVPPQRLPLQRLAGLPYSLPDLASRLYSPAFLEKLRSTLDGGDFDLVQVEGLEMGPYALEVHSRRAHGKRPHLLLDAHNAEHALQRGAFRTDLGTPSRWPVAAYSFIQWQKLMRYERAVCRLADAVLAVSQADAAALRLLEPTVRPKVIPNGVDTSFYGYRSLAGHRESSGDGPALVFTGTLDYRPNVDAAVWFCRHALPQIRRRHPAVRVLLVGRDPAPAVRSLAGRGVTVTGPVEDVRPYLYQSDVFVAPLRMGSGTRFKILEAMACGLPVVSTSLGVEGIAATSGQEAIIADRPPEFAEAVLGLLGNPARAQELATRARLLVEHRYDWKAILPDLEKVYKSMSSRGP
ncbi:MAG TPA: glycosyltransferase [Dehalococcoidia bacterium]|nr:glycosyltransferase [Dehalococcoidia bacterium]